MVFGFPPRLVGVLPALASSIYLRLSAQLARDTTVCIGSPDGGTRSCVFHNRRVTSNAWLTPDAHWLLMFQTVAEVAQFFLAPKCIAWQVDGCGRRKIELQGNPTSVLWFYEMVMFYVSSCVRRSHFMPDVSVAANLTGKVADSVIREPATETHDPAWTEAAVRCEKTILWQVERGTPLYSRSKNYQTIIDLAVPSSEMSHGENQ